jgi:hypothetical protein
MIGREFAGSGWHVDREGRSGSGHKVRELSLRSLIGMVVRSRRLMWIAAMGLAAAPLSACASYTPDSVEDRQPLPSCGRYENLNRPVTVDQKRKNQCLLDALAAGRRVELIRTYATVEGDPITEYYRVLGPRRLEIFVDSTRDSFGDRKWSHWLCRGVERSDVGFPEWSDCRQVPLDQQLT